MTIFNFDSNTSVVLVNAKLSGPKRVHTIRMILDTGASYTLVNPEALAFAGYDLAVETQRRRITTASGIEYVPFITVTEIAALGQQVANVAVCGHSLPGGLPAEGLLGLNFLRHFNVHLNFLDGQLEIISRI